MRRAQPPASDDELRAMLAGWLDAHADRQQAARVARRLLAELAPSTRARRGTRPGAAVTTDQLDLIDFIQAHQGR